MQISERSNASDNFHLRLLHNQDVEIHVPRHLETSIRLLLVDDYVILRQGICALLSAEDDFEVVGEAGTEKAALMLAMELQPDIVLLTSSLETSHGLNAAKQLLRSCSKTRIVLLADSNDEKLLFDALQIGIHGYLPKKGSIDDLLKALRAVQSGERVLGEPHAVTQVVNEFHRLAKEENRLHLGLSITDVELVLLASQGCTNKEIGTRLYWSEVQVKRKMQDIYRKLQVADRAQAVAKAIHLGLI